MNRQSSGKCEEFEDLLLYIYSCEGSRFGSGEENMGHSFHQRCSMKRRESGEERRHFRQLHF